MAKNTKIDYYKALSFQESLTTEQLGELTGLIEKYEAADTKVKAATMKLLMEFEKGLDENTRIESVNIKSYKAILQSPILAMDKRLNLEDLIAKYESANSIDKVEVAKQLLDFSKELASELKAVEQAGKDLGLVETENEQPMDGTTPPQKFSEEFPIPTDPEERKKLVEAFKAAKPNGTLSEEQKANIKNFGTSGESPARINGKIATDEELEALAKENSIRAHTYDAVVEAMEKAKSYINVPGALYSLPMYQVAQGVGLQPIEGAIQFLPFVKGASDNLKTPQQHGIIMEDLYPVLILHLEEYDKVVPSEETKAQIGALKCAFEYCMKRIVERKLRKVWGTMQK